MMDLGQKRKIKYNGGRQSEVWQLRECSHGPGARRGAAKQLLAQSGVVIALSPSLIDEAAA